MTVNPTSANLTLLLRASTHTVLLYALPTTPLTTLKTELLRALASRGITTIGTSQVPGLPPAADDDDADENQTASSAAAKLVDLGIMIDRKDAKKGFKLIGREVDPLHHDDEDNEAEDAEEDYAPTPAPATKKGKGRGKPSSTTNRSSTAIATKNPTVSSVGLRDGDILAFRFTSSLLPTGTTTKSKGKGKALEAEDDVDMLLSKEDAEEGDDNGWDVVMPSYEDEEE